MGAKVVLGMNEPQSKSRQKGLKWCEWGSIPVGAAGWLLQGGVPRSGCLQTGKS